MKLVTRFDDRAIQLAKEFPRAAQSALNRAATQVRKEWARLTSAVYNVTPAQVMETMKDNTSRAGRKRMSVIIKARGPRLSLIKYAAQQMASGVKFSIKRGSTEYLKGRFISVVYGGNKGPGGAVHHGVFERFGEKRVPTRGQFAGKRITRGPLKGMPVMRQPIKERVGPSIPQLMSARKITVKLEQAAIQYVQQFLLEAAQKLGAKGRTK